jgi:hypothetical protein
LLPLNTSHDLDNNNNNRDVNNNRISNRFTNPNDDNDDTNFEPGYNIEQRTSKRSAADINKDNTIDNNVVNNNENSRINKKPRSSQGENHTNTPTSLTEAETMLRDHTQRNFSDVTFSLSKFEPAPTRPLLYTAPPIHQQNNSTHIQSDTAAPSPNFSWFLQTYSPIDYNDPNYDPKFELDQIINPIAKETEKARLW